MVTKAKPSTTVVYILFIGIQTTVVRQPAQPAAGSQHDEAGLGGHMTVTVEPTKLTIFARRIPSEGSVQRTKVTKGAHPPYPAGCFSQKSLRLPLTAAIN